MTSTERRAETPEPQQEESRMSRKTKTTAKPAARNRARGATTTGTATAKEPRKNTKVEAIGKMLAKKDGCTTADILQATNWPAVSVPQQAKALGITLHKKKVDGVTRYADHALAS